MVMDTGRFAILDDPEELMEYARPLTGDPTRQEAILAVDAVHCAATSRAPCRWTWSSVPIRAPAAGRSGACWWASSA